MGRASELLAFGLRDPKQYEFFAKERLAFAIKRHQATRLHADFRFEAFGQLISFASYDLPSQDPRVSIWLREMGDHDPKYMRSERRVPEGSYGAGPMLVWDIGHYRPIDLRGVSDEEAVVTQLQEGRLDLFLKGVRLTGAFRLEVAGHGWRFRKLPDEHAGTLSKPWDEGSVLSGRTLDHIEREYQNSIHRRR